MHTGIGDGITNNDITACILLDMVLIAKIGLDVEQMKQNLGTHQPSQYGNAVSATTVSKCVATWQEEAAENIATDVERAYFERIFNYTKSVAVDGKNYTSKVMDHGEGELATFQDLLALNRGYRWSYMYGGIWVEVSSNGTGKKIGIDLQGIVVESKA
jgi:hypothetical protein